MSLALLALKLVARAAWLRVWRPDTFRERAMQARELNATARAICAEARPRGERG